MRLLVMSVQGNAAFINDYVMVTEKMAMMEAALWTMIIIDISAKYHV